jgi:hypothetical protein
LNLGRAEWAFYHGPIIVPDEGTMAFWTPGNFPLEPSTSSLNAAGATAISRVLPTNPAFDLASFLGELRQGGLKSPGLETLKEKSSYLRSSGSEYLNVEFGWLPLVSDLQSFARAVKTSRKTIDQYRRGSDRKIRRRYEFPLDLQTRTGSGTAFARPSVANVGLDVQVHETQTTKRWFSGAFRYHVPVGDDTYSKLQRYEGYANQILGTRLDPEAVWNLAPWSWAVDWFTNAGDVAHNISTLGFDGLVMQYGYIMETRSVEGTMTATVRPTSQSRTLNRATPMYRTYEYTWKKRQPANPYGFGIDDTSLTTRQLAVLAALGLTKSNRDW